MNLLFVVTFLFEGLGQAAYWGKESCGGDVSLGKTRAGVHSCVTKKEIEESARDMVRRQYDVKNVRQAAIRELKETGQWYDRSRAEVTGFGSTDDTNKELLGMFDVQIKPSHSKKVPAPENETMWEEAKRRAFDRASKPADAFKDARDAILDTQGNLTAKAKESLKPLQDQEVKEIFAHSWGTQIVYNAILEGVIKPPRRLILFGAPENNKEKWLLLAEHTGTMVIFAKDASDVVNAGGDLAGKTANWWQAGQDEKKWKQACGPGVRNCNPHQRRGGFESIKIEVPGLGFDHDRLGYYNALFEKQKVLDILGLQPLAGGTVRKKFTDLRAEGEKDIKTVSKRIFSEAVATTQESWREQGRAEIIEQDRLDAAFEEASRLAEEARPLAGPGVNPNAKSGT